MKLGQSWHIFCLVCLRTNLSIKDLPFWLFCFLCSGLSFCRNLDGGQCGVLDPRVVCPQ